MRCCAVVVADAAVRVVIVFVFSQSCLASKREREKEKEGETLLDCLSRDSSPSLSFWLS